MLGPLRVVGVRVVVGEDPPVNEAVAVLHRRPVVQRISAATAAELAARGVPLVVGRRSGYRVESERDQAAAMPEGG